MGFKCGCKQCGKCGGCNCRCKCDPIGTIIGCCKSAKTEGKNTALYLFSPSDQKCCRRTPLQLLLVSAFTVLVYAAMTGISLGFFFLFMQIIIEDDQPHRHNIRLQAETYGYSKGKRLVDKLDRKYGKWMAFQSILAIPGLSAHPRPYLDDDVTSVQGFIDKYMEDIDKFLKEHVEKNPQQKNSTFRRELSDSNNQATNTTSEPSPTVTPLEAAACSMDKYEQPTEAVLKKSCPYDFSEHLRTSNCSKENSYGFANKSPCFIVKLNRAFGFVPDPMDFPISKFEDPKVWANKDDSVKHLPILWFRCAVEKGKEAGLNGIEYHPYPGFHLKYFPYLNQKDYQSPIVFVKFNFAESFSGEISFLCKTYASNMPHIEQMTDVARDTATYRIKLKVESKGVKIL